MSHSEEIMESILPSEVARLVYGYLLEDCKGAAQQFLEGSPHLQECQKIIRNGRRFNTRFHGRNLVQILDLFTNIYSIVRENVEKMGQISKEETGERLVEQLCQLLDLNSSPSKCNNTNTSSNMVLLNITVPSQDESNEKSKQGATVRRRLSEPEGISQGMSRASISRSSSPGTSRKADNNAPDDNTVDFVLLNLLDNTELHEKIAEKINKVIATPEKESTGTGTDMIKTIVKETEEDPWIQGLISEIINASGENECGEAKEADDTEINFRESLELQRKTNDSSVEEKTPASIKQRLRNSKAKSKSNGCDTSKEPFTVQNESSVDNSLGNLKNSKSQNQKDNNCDDYNSELGLNESERKQVEKPCMLQTAMSNCNINSSPETPNKVNSNTKSDSVYPLKDRPEPLDMNFCFIDVNEASHQSAPASPPREPVAPTNHELDPSNMIVLADSNQIPTSTTPMIVLANADQTSTIASPMISSNSQIIFTPRNQNTTMMTLPSPLFGSGSIFTVIPPSATSTPIGKQFNAVVITEDPLKVPNNNIYTESDISMAIPVAATPLSWDYVPIVPKPAVPDSEATQMLKQELDQVKRKRGQHWRRGLKGSIKKTVSIRRTELRNILPKRPPVRNLKNLPHQRLVNGVEIQVLDGLTFNQASETGLPTIVEFVHEDLTTTDERDENLNENKAQYLATDENHDKEYDGQDGTSVVRQDKIQDEKSSTAIENLNEENISPIQNLDKGMGSMSIIQTDKGILGTSEERKTSSNGTPGPPTRKKLSLSTPRRRSSHVRALDFNTPSKGFSSRRSITSPKRIPSPRKSMLNNVKRAKLFRSPTLSARNNSINTGQEQELVFKSPISKDPVPIATLSPAPTPLKGDWDKVNGVQMIINPETENESPVGNKCKSKLWDKDLRALITGEYQDPLPPPKKQTKNKSKQTPIKKLTQKKNIKKRKIAQPKKPQDTIENIFLQKNNDEKSIEEEKRDGIINTNDDIKIEKNSVENNPQQHSETEIANSFNKNEVLSGKSKLGKNNLTEKSLKPTDNKVTNNFEGDIDKGSEKSKNSDNEGLLIVVDDEVEENNILDSSTMSESVVGLRIEENLRHIIGDEHVANREKNECSSSSDVMTALLGQNPEKKDNTKIESVELSGKCAETEVHSQSVVTDVSVRANLQVGTDFVIPVALLSNDILTKPLGVLPMLETPVKLDFAGLVPKTPYLDTPILKTIRENTSVLASDLLLTPSLPPTPFQDGASNSHSNLSDKTPNKDNQDDILNKECGRMAGENILKSDNIGINENKGKTEKRDDKGDNNVESGIKSSNISNKQDMTPIKKTPDKVKKSCQKKSPSAKLLHKSRDDKNINGKNKYKSYRKDSKISSKSIKKNKKKKKTPEQLIEEYLKQAKEELFGGDISSSDDDIFERKIGNKTATANSIYYKVYSDDSSEDLMQRSSKNTSPSKSKNSPKQFIATNKTNFVDDSDSDSDEEIYYSLKGMTNVCSLDEKRQRMVNKMKDLKSPTSPNKSTSEIGISFNTSISVPNSMKELVEKSQSPKKLFSQPKSQISPNTSKSKILPKHLSSLFTPPKLADISQKEDIPQNTPSLLSSKKSPCPMKANNLNTIADKLARRKSNDNNNDFPPLYLSPEDDSDGHFDKNDDHLKNNKLKKSEVRNFPINKHQIDITRKTPNTLLNEAKKIEELQILNKELKKPHTVFLSKNETFTVIVFDEVNFKPKPVIKIDDFDNFEVDIIVDIDEAGKEIYGTLSVQPLQILMDIEPKTDHPPYLKNDYKSSKSSSFREQSSQKQISSTDLSFKKCSEKDRDTSSNRSHKSSARNSKSRHLEKKESSVSRWKDTPQRTMECTRRSDGKRRIKPIRIDDYEYESRLKRREYDDRLSRYERYDTRYKSRSSLRPNRDKSRTRREDDNDRNHYQNETSHIHERKSHDRRKSESEKKNSFQTDQSVEKEDRRQKQESEIQLVLTSERTINSYDDKLDEEEEEKNLTEDDLMNMAVMSGSSSLTPSRKMDKLRNSQEAEICPRKLPPKKRKASTDEGTSDVPEKKSKSDGPQALLQKVDLDHFLSVVHGENSTASPPT